MSLIKEQIQYFGVDTSIIINLGQNVNFTGYQQGIDNFTGEATIAAINLNNDLESYRFNLSIPVSLDFYFYNSLLSSYISAFIFTEAGFSIDDITNNTLVMQNSFFIANFYDTFDSQTQTKFFTGYLTYLIDPLAILKTPHYNINPTGSGRQFYYFFIPNNYIETYTGTTATGYTQFTFYNAKLGKIQLFFNQKNSGLTTNEKLCFKTIINFTNKTFYFADSSPLKAYQVPTASVYVDKYNTSVTSMTMKREVYPSGTSFNFLTGKYDVI